MDKPKNTVGLLASDYASLERHATSQKVYKLVDVKDKIEKVAFDVVRFRDAGGLDKLWVIEEHNGEQVLVAMYDDDNEVQKEATASDKGQWSVLSDNAGNLSVFYKSEPIVRVAMSKLGLPKEDASMVSRYLPNKLANDSGLAKALLAELPKADRDVLVAKYPELKRGR